MIEGTRRPAAGRAASTAGSLSLPGSMLVGLVVLATIGSMAIGFQVAARETATWSRARDPILTALEISAWVAGPVAVAIFLAVVVDLVARRARWALPLATVGSAVALTIALAALNAHIAYAFGIELSLLVTQVFALASLVAGHYRGSPVVPALGLGVALVALLLSSGLAEHARMVVVLWSAPAALALRMWWAADVRRAPTRRPILAAAAAVAILWGPALALPAVPQSPLVSPAQAVLSEVPLAGWTRDGDTRCGEADCLARSLWRPGTTAVGPFRGMTIEIHTDRTRAAAIDRTLRGCDGGSDLTFAPGIPVIGSWDVLCHHGDAEGSGTAVFTWLFVIDELKTTVSIAAAADVARAPTEVEGFNALMPIALAQYRAICGCRGPKDLAR